MALESADNSQEAEKNIVLLQQRLRRLEFLLTGSSDLDGLPNGLSAPEKSDDTVSAKLSGLKTALDDLRRVEGIGGTLVRDLEAIYRKFPELLSSNKPATATDVASQASIVLSHATVYPETASRLSSLQSLQIPSAEQSARLSQLEPRLKECQKMQQELEREVQDLRQRSARCLEWWVKVGVVGMGDLWEEWEDRLKDIEQHVKRAERIQKEEEGFL